MKILCIKNPGYPFMSEGEWYTAEESIFTNQYKVYHDGVFDILSKKWFKTLQQIREEQLEKLGII